MKLKPFGEVLVDLLNKRGLNIPMLAVKTGLHKSTLYAYAKGRNVPSIYTAYDIATALGCGIEELLGLESKQGTFTPPIEIGQTVYTPVPAALPIDTPIIEVWTVEGVAYKGGKWYAIDKYGYLQEVGKEEDCLLTEEEAQAVLERSKK